jgi:hypothetical protein
LANALLISKMTAASLWTFRISWIKNMLYYVCVALIVRDTFAWCSLKYSSVMCNFYVLLLLLNWWIGTLSMILCALSSCGMELFELFFCNHTVKSLCNHTCFLGVVKTT